MLVGDIQSFAYLTEEIINVSVFSSDSIGISENSGPFCVWD